MAPGGAPPSAPPDSNGKADSQWFLLRFLQLAAPFFTSEERWKAWLITGGLIALTLLQIGIAIRLNIWNRDFFNSLESRDWNAFLYQMGLFALLASATMGVAVYQTYVKQLLQLRWRRWLTAKLVDRWLAEGRYHQLGLIEAGVDNPAQPISENTQHSTEQAGQVCPRLTHHTVSLRLVIVLFC